jgi:hypothetical protein
MASKDFLYDLLDKLEEQRQEYVLLTIEKREDENVGELFYNFLYEDSKEDASKILSKLSKIILEHPDSREDIEIDIQDEDEDEDEEL